MPTLLDTQPNHPGKVERGFDPIVKIPELFLCTRNIWEAACSGSSAWCNYEIGVRSASSCLSSSVPKIIAMKNAGEILGKESWRNNTRFLCTIDAKRGVHILKASRPDMSVSRPVDPLFALDSFNCNDEALHIC